ncbi:MauE/DoxX family redox-associated membrane protein [Allorhizocola rhizosphaerae]|uniref:MauE/DoxX family redox-associated membrane protein n=1 Tax=Allorhizocola rhizosphaerae TaxID=1872709 RepID=UPI000E3BCF85
MSPWQLVFVGGVLAWSGGFKLFARTAPVAAASSALRTLVGQRHTVWVYRTVGAVELAVVASLPFTRMPAVVLSLAFIGYLAYGRLKAPTSSCGCSSAHRSPIGWRNFAFAGVLLAALFVPAVAVAGFVLGFALSPQFDRYWLIPLRQWKVRLTHPLASAQTDETPLHSTVQQLQRSDAYRKVGQLLRSDVVDSWDEGEWRMLRYTMRYQERTASAVFAVPRHADEPARVRLAVVDDTDDAILFTA